MKRIEFFTLGCKVNQYETQGMREQLLHAGFQENSSRKAGICIINTCTVTEHADSESCRLIRKAIISNPKAKIIVTGCLVEKDADKILQISDKIQIVYNRQKQNILAYLSAAHAAERKAQTDIFSLKISDFADHQRAFVKVQDGCDNFCSYCKVPLVRGRSMSREPQEVVREVERLTKKGFKEIILSGICMGDYQYRNCDLAGLLASLEKIAGEFRIRLSSIEPQLISDGLLAKIAVSQKICPHLHIPVQSGDAQILKRMNRRYTVKGYLSLINKIKKNVKDVAITTDVLVGFPGEKERNFLNTIGCIKEILPLRTHIFPFSLRQGTASFDFPERIEAAVIKKRVNLLQKVTAECSYKFRKQFLGKRLSVLIESQPAQQTNALAGYSENYIRVIVENSRKKDIDNLLPVKVHTVDIQFTKARKIRDKRPG